MYARQLPFEVTASHFLPPAFRGLARPLDPAFTRLLIPDELVRTYSASRDDGQSAQQFVSNMLQQLEIGYRISDADLERIPTTGPLLVVANHPFGILEGLILVDLLEKVRPDFRIVANTLLASTPALHQKVFFVDPFAGASPFGNSQSVRASLEWLRKGGLLLTFPAGEVSHLNWGGETPIVDPKWNTAAARLARKVGCPTLPLFFRGANSFPFQMMGAVHPRLRTLNLARELVKKRGHTVEVRTGTLVSTTTLQRFPTAEEATDYLRARTYLLSNRPQPATLAAPAPRRVYETNLTLPVMASALESDVASLSAEHIVASNADFDVVLAPASKIPNVLREIGRLRELTYRSVGEGTGKPLDIDEFDSHYQHLFLWHKQSRQVAGAYRLAATPDILPKHGIKGLYTSSLFHFAPDFFERIGPALELGRSFILAEFQKQYAPLLLLWKGITAYVQRRPECAVVFGAVSISSDYHALSRALIVNYLEGHLANELAAYVRPRRAFRRNVLLPKHVRQLGSLISNMEELTGSVQDLERDGKALPILIRQYTKIGGQFIGFNVDPNFSNAVDALALADLRTASLPMLERLMTRAGAQAFRASLAPSK